MNDRLSALKPYLDTALCALFICFLTDTTKESLRVSAYFFAFILIAAFLLLHTDRKRLRGLDPAMVILAAGIFLKLLYVLYTAVWTRQHDVVDFGVGEGHAGYIEYIFTHNTLPPGDPRDTWAFFQPPLHHVIAAVWMKVGNRLGFAYRQLQENIQALTFFYVSAATLLSDNICRELSVGKKGRIGSALMIAFHPVFILMSGSINNDALSLFLMILALYIAIRWYKKPSFTLIILLALSLGLSMMAKLSGGLLAPAVAVLFLRKLFTDREKIGKFLLQYVVFGIIVFPLGIWWELRNMLRYGMPFNYIPPVGEQLVKTDLFSRLFDLRMHSVYPAMVINGDAYDEYNVFLAMFKTSLFDDANLSSEWALIDPFAVILFVSGLILTLICVFLAIRALFGKDGLATEWRLLLGIFAVTMLAAYFSFALSAGNYSAENFRYISALVIVSGVLSGYALEHVQKGLQRIAYMAMAVFSSACAIVYILLGFAR